MSKRDNTPVWKDTNKYPFAIQYTYPLAIRNRCLFFWATTLKGWKAVLNLASNLAEPNRVCVVYLFGETKQETLLKYCKGSENLRLIVLWADYCGNSEIEVVMNGVETIKK